MSQENKDMKVGKELVKVQDQDLNDVNQKENVPQLNEGEAIKETEHELPQNDAQMEQSSEEVEESSSQNEQDSQQHPEQAAKDQYVLEQSIEVPEISQTSSKIQSQQRMPAQQQSLADSQLNLEEIRMKQDLEVVGDCRLSKEEQDKSQSQQLHQCEQIPNEEFGDSIFGQSVKENSVREDYVGVQYEDKPEEKVQRQTYDIKPDQKDNRISKSDLIRYQNEELQLKHVSRSMTRDNRVQEVVIGNQDGIKSVDVELSKQQQQESEKLKEVHEIQEVEVQTEQVVVETVEGNLQRVEIEGMTVVEGIMEELITSLQLLQNVRETKVEIINVNIQQTIDENILPQRQQDIEREVPNNEQQTISDIKVINTIQKTSESKQPKKERKKSKKDKKDKKDRKDKQEKIEKGKQQKQTVVQPINNPIPDEPQKVEPGVEQQIKIEQAIRQEDKPQLDIAKIEQCQQTEEKEKDEIFKSGEEKRIIEVQEKGVEPEDIKQVQEVLLKEQIESKSQKTHKKKRKRVRHNEEQDLNKLKSEYKSQIPQNKPNSQDPDKNNKKVSDSQQILTNVSLNMPKTEEQHDNAVLIHRNREPLPPPLTSLIIVGEAYKERMGSTYNIFLRYVGDYTKALNFYKRITENVTCQISRRKNQKKRLQGILTDYFEGYAKLNQQFNDKTLSFQYPQMPTSNNKYGNLMLELRPGYQQLIEIRKTAANESLKINNFVCNHVMKNINQAFATYFEVIGSEERRQAERREQHRLREKTFYNVISQVEKVFKKGMKGKFKTDILTELARFVIEETTHRQYLKTYGKGIVPLRHILISSENQLFIALQQILNEFKTESKVIYSVGKRQFSIIEDLSRSIKETTKFTELSPLTDIDYIRYVLEIQQKKQYKEFKSQHVEQFLDLVYWDRLMGDIRDVYKGAICKVFPMWVEHQELIHTVSGNLVHFNRESDQCLNTFVIRNVNARLLGEGVVEFDQMLKGVIFDDSRTVRVKLKDDDRAEELICYLNEKEDDFIVEESLNKQHSME